MEKTAEDELIEKLLDKVSDTYKKYEREKGKVKKLKKQVHEFKKIIKELENEISSKNKESK